MSSQSHVHKVYFDFDKFSSRCHNFSRSIARYAAHHNVCVYLRLIKVMSVKRDAIVLFPFAFHDGRRTFFFIKLKFCFELDNADNGSKLCFPSKTAWKRARLSIRSIAKYYQIYWMWQNNSLKAFFDMPFNNKTSFMSTLQSQSLSM